MRSIIHISDLHFGTEIPEIATALLETIRALNPDLVAVSGDLTQRARTKQFQAAKTLIDNIGAPWLAVPGNHDMPLFDLLHRLSNPLGRFHRFINRDPFPRWEDEEVTVLGISTPRIFRVKDGRISYEQMEKMRETFCEAGERTRILVMHHPLIPPSGGPRSPVVRRAEKMLFRVEGCRPDMVLSGHLHESYSGDTVAVYRSTGGSTLVLQAGTAVSGRIRREPNAFNEIRIERDQTLLTVRVWNGRGFLPQPSDRFRRCGGVWEKG